MEAKVQLDHLEKELQIKSSQLKDNKAESQQLAEHNNRREDDVAEVQIKCEELRGTNELLRME
jgi:predicted nuclease with TOPRIM domain